jgi:hypothetical protein
MIIPLAYTEQEFRGACIAIFCIVLFFLLRYYNKKGKYIRRVSHAEYAESYKIHEQARKEKKKKRRQTAEWEKKAKKLSKLQKGDNQAKISSVIGKPDSIQKEEEVSGQETWIYDCGTEGKMSIAFKDGFIEKIEVKY